MKYARTNLLVALCFICSWTYAAGTPPCLSDKGQDIAVNNDQVIQWEQTTDNQFLARAHVQGVIERIFANESGHNHFEIRIGSSAQDLLEVIYDTKFGKLPELSQGMTVDTCGDYITSNAATQYYPVSPDGAIIHWIHMSTTPKKHPSGFLAINGTVYGLK